jgi:hypothetical protein
MEYTAISINFAVSTRFLLRSSLAWFDGFHHSEALISFLIGSKLWSWNDSHEFLSLIADPQLRLKLITLISPSDWTLFLSRLQHFHAWCLIHGWLFSMRRLVSDLAVPNRDGSIVNKLLTKIYWMRQICTKYCLSSPHNDRQLKLKLRRPFLFLKAQFIAILCHIKSIGNLHKFIHFFNW